jgi:hypothetical protein
LGFRGAAWGWGHAWSRWGWWGLVLIRSSLTTNDEIEIEILVGKTLPAVPTAATGCCHCPAPCALRPALCALHSALCALRSAPCSLPGYCAAAGAAARCALRAARLVPPGVGGCLAACCLLPPWTSPDEAELTSPSPRLAPPPLPPSPTWSGVGSPVGPSIWPHARPTRARGQGGGGLLFKSLALQSSHHST